MPDAVAFTLAFRVLRRHILLILGIVACTTGAATFLALQDPPEYRAAAVVRLGNGRQALTGGIGEAINLTTESRTVDPVLSLMERLRNRQVVGNVVDSLGLRLGSATPNFSTGSLGAVHVDADAPADSINLFFADREVVAQSQGRQTRARYGNVLQLDGVRFAVPARPAVATALLTVTPWEKEIDQILGKLELVQRQSTDVVDVAYSDPDPLLAQRVINTLVQTFQNLNIKAAQEQSRLRRVFLSDQLRLTDSSLAEAQATLGQFRSKQELANTGDKLAAAQAALLALDAQREQLKAERRAFGELPELLRSPSDSLSGLALEGLAFSPEMASNPLIGRLAQELVHYQLRLDSLTTGPWRSAATMPDVLQLQALVKTTKQELSGAVAGQIRSLDARIQALADLRARSGASIKTLPALQAEEMRLQARTEALSTLGDQLRQEVQKAHLSEEVEVGDMQVLNLAGVPYVSVWASGWLKIGMGLLVGLMLGGGVAYLLEANNTAVRRPEDLEGILQLAGLAIIPRVATGQKGWRLLGWLSRGSNEPQHRRQRHSHAGSSWGRWRRLSRLLHGENGHHRSRGGTVPDGLVTLSQPRSVGSEAFRMLRTNLVSSEWGRKLKTIVITSVAPGEGKTLTAANLAVIFARQGMRTVLVDSDLRRARLHRIFSMPRGPGLTELLGSLVTTSGGEAAIPLAQEDELYRTLWQTGVDRLSLLPAGRPSHSSDTFQEGRLQQVLGTLSNMFDLVMVDAPPVLATADAAVLASMADGVLLVVRAGQTDRRAVQRAYQQLANVGAHVVGIVLNDPQGELKQLGDYYYPYEYLSTHRSATK